MSFLYKLNKPEYFYNPKQFINRITKANFKQESSIMPWGNKLHYNPNEDIGRAINILGVYELPLTEMMYRAFSNVNHFVDIGANIGYYTSLASSIDNIHSVTSFEPHPQIFGMLSKNANESNNKISLKNYAASNCESTADLYIPKNFDENMGIASLEKPVEEETEKISIKTTPLDTTLDHDKEYCFKIDTEGHEASVLKGAQELLKSNCIKYIFFEEFGKYPDAETFKIILENDYNIFRIDRTFFGPKLSCPHAPIKSRQWQPINFFAIKKNDKTIQDFLKSGWSFFKL